MRNAFFSVGCRFLLPPFVLMICQLILKPTTSFMGQEVSDSLSTGLAEFAKIAVVSEFLKVYSLHLLLYLPFYFLFIKKAQNNLLKILLFLMLLQGYGLFLAASILEFPTLYENFLPPKAREFFFNLSFSENPFKIKRISLIIMALGLFGVFFNSLKAHKKKLITLILLYLLISNDTAIQLGEFEKSAQKSHVFFLAIDSLRWDSLDNLPRIKELENDPQSCLFKDHFVGIPRTFPSWVEIISGEYAMRTGIRHMFPRLDKTEKPFLGIVRDFKHADYNTGVISDFAGDIFPRFDAGFTEVKAPDLNIPTLVKMGLVQAFPLILPLVLNPWGEKFFDSVREIPTYSNPKTLVTEAITRVKNQKNKKNFLTVFFSTAHFPYAAPWPYYSKFSEKEYKGPYFFQKNPDLYGKQALTNEDRKQVLSLYKGSLRAIDEAIGEFFDFLKKENLWESSTIILSADHGEDLFDQQDIYHGHGDHLLGEHSIKVPLILKLPHKVPERKTLDFITRSIDLAPTLRELYQLSGEKVYQGKSLLSYISDKNLEAPNLQAYSETGIWFSRNDIYFFQKTRLEYPGINALLVFDPDNSGQIVLNHKYENFIITAKHRTMIEGHFKLLYTPTHQGPIYSLFHRINDPLNRYDVKNQYPAQFQRLKASLEELILQDDPGFIRNSDYFLHNME